MQVFAFLETSHLFNRFYSWPLTTINAGLWQESSGREVCKYFARNGHIASLEHACLGDVMWEDQSGQFRFNYKFRTPEAVGAAFQAAALGGDLAMCLRLREKYFSWEFSCQDSWSSRLICKAAAESGSMELCKWLKDTGLPWNWRWVHAAAPDSLVGTDTGLARWD